MKASEETIRKVIREALGALKMINDLHVQVIASGTSKDVKIEEIMTDIRVIKGIATVSQDGAIDRTPTGRRVIDLTITFDVKGDVMDYVDKLSRGMKKNIEAIDTVILKTLNGRPLRDDQGRRVVY